MKVGYVILHYLSIEDTIKCVDSIKKAHGEEKFYIVVVDNASSNGTGKTLAEYYEEEEDISVVLNSKNMGFAKGMNCGIRELKNKYSVDFIALLNNDLELIGSNWAEIIIKKYEEYNYAVLGPDIISYDSKRHENPSTKQDITAEGLKKMIRSKKALYFGYWSFYIPIIQMMKKWVKKIINYSEKEVAKNKVDQDMIDVQLQGSCLILSPSFFEHYEGLFENTFLYFEEAILRYMCEKKAMFCMYTPELELFHKGGISTNDDLKKKRKNKMFYLKHSLDSCKKLYEVVLKDNEK